MSAIAHQWNPPKNQFWLFGERPDAPVRYEEESGTWNVCGYPEAHEILADPAAFSSNTFRLMPKGMFPDELSPEGFITQMDPPDHSKLRKLVSRAFTPKVVADLEPRIAKLTHELLDAVAERGRMELVADLAYPLPVTVIAELLGVPASDRDLFKTWVDAMFVRTNRISLVKQTEEDQRAMATTMENIRLFSDYLAEHAVERRRRPREDLITKLVEAEVDGERLPDTQVVNFAFTLLIAGHITTTMLLGNTVLCLDAHPDQQAKARADRSTIPAVIEESLRFLTPFAAVGRSTTRELDLGGVTIPADQVLMVWIAAANRDPRQFRDPDAFDPSRDPNPHLAFGRGIHFCMGAPLARLEGRVALGILFDRFAELRTDPADPVEFIPTPTMTGVRRLPLTIGS
jgi:cytochrome P450